MVLAVLTSALVAPALTLVAPAQALDPAGVGPRNPDNHGFPAYYTDDAGVALQMCDDGSAACLGAGPAALTPPEGENFYWMATSEVTTADFDIAVEIAAEAAWLGPGQPITFDRLRIRGHSDVGDITVTTPYGTTTVAADPPTEQRNINFTEDIGCAVAPCNFAEMTSSPSAHITNWITSTTAPAGRLGDGVTSAPATVGGQAATLTVQGVSTDEWVVMGKRANPNAVSLPATVDFGNVRRAATKTVRIRNLGTQPRTITSTALAGSATISRLGTSTCTDGRVLGVGGSCTVNLRYRPDGSKQSRATLTLTSPQGNRTVRLSASTAAVAQTRRQLEFRPVRSGASGPTRRLVVTNSGSLPLQLRGVSLAGRSPGSFDIRRGAPRVCARGARVPVGQQCAVYLGFEPVGFGTKSASLVIRSNGLDRAVNVALSGRAR
jgi:hypothetical protein